MSVGEDARSTPAPVPTNGRVGARHDAAAKFDLKLLAWRPDTVFECLAFEIDESETCRQGLFRGHAGRAHEPSGDRQLKQPRFTMAMRFMAEIGRDDVETDILASRRSMEFYANDYHYHMLP